MPLPTLSPNFLHPLLLLYPHLSILPENFNPLFHASVALYALILLSPLFSLAPWPNLIIPTP